MTGKIGKNEDLYWIQKARQVFKADKPEHFTNYMHCCECAEHDEVLKSSNVDTIGFKELGNPGWDPICFSSEQGKKYYMPAFVRLSLETIHDEFYIDQFLFHLEGNGRQNNLFLSCSPEQKRFIAAFLEYLIETFPEQIQRGFYGDQILRVHDIWSED